MRLFKALVVTALVAVGALFWGMVFAAELPAEPAFTKPALAAAGLNRLAREGNGSGLVAMLEATCDQATLDAIQAACVPVRTDEEKLEVKRAAVRAMQRIAQEAAVWDDSATLVKALETEAAANAVVE